jgi:hypothetical protein
MRSMPKPVLRQFGELRPDDFERHPVWIGCHTADHDEEWYEETDEETFRPHVEPLPADPRDGMLLVRATATLNDGSELQGFLTPEVEKADLGAMQPHVFVSGLMFGFWTGMASVSDDMRNDFYGASGKDSAQVFPLVVRAEPGVATGVTEVQVRDFTSLARSGGGLLSRLRRRDR